MKKAKVKTKQKTKRGKTKHTNWNRNNALQCNSYFFPSVHIKYYIVNLRVSSSLKLKANFFVIAVTHFQIDLDRFSIYIVNHLDLYYWNNLMVDV